MKKLLALALAIVLCLSLAACGAESSASTASDSSTSVNTAYVEPGYYEEDQYDYGEMTKTASSVSAGDGSGTENAALNRENVKMIYRAYLDIQTVDFEGAVSGLEELTASLNGYVESSSIDRGSYGSANSYRYGSFVIRVPSEQLPAFIQAASEQGGCYVTSQSVESENVSTAYFDLETRLATQRTQLERLEALLAKAENMEDIITLTNAISEVEYTIESYTTSLNKYDSLIDYATVNVSLAQVVRLTETVEEPATLGSRMASAFQSGLGDLGDWLGNLAVGTSYFCVPLAALAAVVIILLTVRHRRRVRRKAEAARAQEESEQ